MRVLGDAIVGGGCRRYRNPHAGEAGLLFDRVAEKVRRVSVLCATTRPPRRFDPEAPRRLCEQIRDAGSNFDNMQHVCRARFGLILDQRPF